MIAQKHQDGIIAREVVRLIDRMAKTQLLPLVDICDLLPQSLDGHIDLPHFLGQLALVIDRQIPLEQPVKVRLVIRIDDQRDLFNPRVFQLVQKD